MKRICETAITRIAPCGYTSHSKRPGFFGELPRASLAAGGRSFQHRFVCERNCRSRGAIRRISPVRCIRFTFCLSGRVLAIVPS